MPSQNLWDNIVGTWDVMLGRSRGLARVDTSSDGVWFSFAGLLVAGLVDASVLSARHGPLFAAGSVDVSKPAFMAGSLFSAFFAYALSMAFLYLLCRQPDETGRYSNALILHNWASSIVSVALLPLSLFWVSTGTQDSTLGVVLMLAIIGFVGLAGVRMVRIGLDVTPGRALALFLLTMLLSLVVDYYLRHWLGVAVNAAQA
ncbi:MAG: hypothetical protein AAGK38_10135 [Pseudomonadota bacterium]